MSEELELRALLGDQKYKRLKNIRHIAEQREKFLKNTLQGKYTGRLLVEPENIEASVDPRFIIARKWNSWYPSYFDTEGGCYAFLLPRMDYPGNTETSGPSAVIVDPGFKFLDTLKPYGINVSDIGAIIVSHFHMDHMAGLAEFLTLIHERQSGSTCRIYLNETTFDFYKDLHTKNVEFYELKRDEKRLIGRYKRTDGLYECLYLKPFTCHHREMGSYSNTLGLAFELGIRKSVSDSRNLSTAKIGILGDTDGIDEHLDDYIDRLKGSDVLVFHLGTVCEKKVQQKYGSGEGHLYDVGIIKMLNKISSKPEFNSLKSVVVSEFGLEMSHLSNFPKMLRKFDPPNEWILILNLARRIDLKSRRDDGSNDADLVALELQVFSTLSVEFLLSGKWLSEISRIRIPTCLLFGYLCYMKNPPKFEKLHLEMCKKVQAITAGYSPPVFNLTIATKMLEIIRGKLSSLITSEARELAKSLVLLLIKVCPDEKRTELISTLRSFTGHIGYQSLLNMIVRKFLFISLPAIRVSQRIVQIYDHEAIVSPFQNLSDLAKIHVSFTSLCWVLAMLDELDSDLEAIVKEAESKYPEVRRESVHFFNELIHILSGLVSESRSLLIGDVGFDALLQYNSRTNRFDITVKAEGDFSAKTNVPISKAKSVEDDSGQIHYRSK